MCFSCLICIIIASTVIRSDLNYINDYVQTVCVRNRTSVMERPCFDFGVVNTTECSICQVDMNGNSDVNCTQVEYNMTLQATSCCTGKPGCCQEICDTCTVERTRSVPCHCQCLVNTTNVRLPMIWGTCTTLRVIIGVRNGSVSVEQWSQGIGTYSCSRDDVACVDQVNTMWPLINESTIEPCWYLTPLTSPIQQIQLGLRPEHQRNQAAIICASIFGGIAGFILLLFIGITITEALIRRKFFGSIIFCECCDISCGHLSFP